MSSRTDVFQKLTDRLKIDTGLNALVIVLK